MNLLEILNKYNLKKEVESKINELCKIITERTKIKKRFVPKPKPKAIGKFFEENNY